MLWRKLFEQAQRKGRRDIEIHLMTQGLQDNHVATNIDTLVSRENLGRFQGFLIFTEYQKFRISR
ncbi:hypothetical protein [Candidatus Parabeggiatoa sp. HSG14]|uniref:hypothetical protein n=1 Tax=Candidatus Parabeggiatoa sp. HSG14 TaxID=3055593 RepID=UPI0025A7D197|nr:hypothetical protein [Thiotrichales bacterium HSG14]